MSIEVPWHALFGGMLLGLSATLLLLFNGRIAGISGIFSGLLTANKGDIWWRGLFLLGMVFAGLAVNFYGVEFPDYGVNSSLITIAIAGLFVGLGTKIGNGCTSGHGICGMGRLSKRSIVATMIFMFVAVLTVFVRFHL